MQQLSYIDSGIETWIQLSKLVSKDLYSKIESLNLHSNKLTKIEPNIKLFKSLKQLDLSSNNIEDLSGVEGAPTIIYLNVSANRLWTLNPIMLSNLEYLNISFNNVESISNLTNLKKLEYLDVQGNRIKSLKEFTFLKNLKVINVN